MKRTLLLTLAFCSLASSVNANESKCFTTKEPVRSIGKAYFNGDTAWGCVNGKLTLVGRNPKHRDIPVEVLPGKLFATSTMVYGKTYTGGRYIWVKLSNGKSVLVEPEYVHTYDGLD